LGPPIPNVAARRIWPYGVKPVFHGCTDLEKQKGHHLPVKAPQLLEYVFLKLNALEKITTRKCKKPSLHFVVTLPAQIRLKESSFIEVTVALHFYALGFGEIFRCAFASDVQILRPNTVSGLIRLANPASANTAVQFFAFLIWIRNSGMMRRLTLQQQRLE
jgi:hypothetical protein